MAIRRRSVNTWVKLLKKSDDYYFFKLGSKPLKAAKLIQKSVRKFLFRQKMRRILNTYNKIRQQKVVEIKNLIRTYIRIFLGKKVISDIKFENYKAERLIKIRQKLCILLMKSFWKKNKFTFKIVMTRIKKYKRMKKNEERMKASKANLLQGKDGGKKTGTYLGIGGATGCHSSRSSFCDDSELGSDNEEGREGKEEVESHTSEINKKLEAERQEKIAIAKVAYSIPKKKEPINVLPFLYQKDILESVSPPSHHISTTRACVFRMIDSNPRRQNLSILSHHSSELNNKAVLSKPQTSATTRPKVGQDGNPLYMKQTTAYKMSRWDAENPADEIEEPKKNIKPRDDSKVLSGTFTSMQKVSKVFIRKEKFKVWRPNTRHQDLYVTNVDNFNFAPPVKQKKRPQTMSFSPRVRKVENCEPEKIQGVEMKIEVNTLSFDAALPGLANIVNSYKGGFRGNARPGTQKLGRLS